jgi:hypothetical protein
MVEGCVNETLAAVEAKIAAELADHEAVREGRSPGRLTERARGELRKRALHEVIAPAARACSAN